MPLSGASNWQAFVRSYLPTQWSASSTHNTDICYVMAVGMFGVADAAMYSSLPHRVLG